ncbi:hypothetical protein EYF80_021542 [Liparis tanakae]|uniref:Uncharacterized protein n=1 Tax=Liparis tanakae TaxID=230148 RepID=A0A4Z2HRH7_9TELE|nr:hypothetical protein EYF80_021542 [Liparis tanakae]
MEACVQSDAYEVGLTHREALSVCSGEVGGAVSLPLSGSVPLQEEGADGSQRSEDAQRRLFEALMRVALLLGEPPSTGAVWPGAAAAVIPGHDADLSAGSSLSACS